MPSLQVRDLPDNIYSLLQKRARKDHRSLAQEAVFALAKGLQTSTSNIERRQALLQEIASSKPVGEKTALPDPVALLREDRDR